MIASSPKSVIHNILHYRHKKYSYIIFVMKGQNIEQDDAIPMSASPKNYINSHYEI